MVDSKESNNAVDATTTATPPQVVDENTPKDPQGSANKAASNGAIVDQPSNLFVGDISNGVGEQQLRELFEQFGTVVKVDIKKDRATGNNLGYGFVAMSTIEEAVESKKNLNNTMLCEKRIRIGWAQQNTNLFIGDLGGDVDDQVLRDVFRKFGDIYENDTFVKHGSYGFVRFKTRADAETAKREMNGKELIPGSGKVVRIGWGDSNTQKQTVHFRFDIEHLPKITEAFIRDIFSKYGQVDTITLPNPRQHKRGAATSTGNDTSSNVETPKQPSTTSNDDEPTQKADAVAKRKNHQSPTTKGFGFVHYQDTREGEYAATEAIEQVNGRTFNGIMLLCSFGKRKPYYGNHANNGNGRSDGSKHHYHAKSKGSRDKGHHHHHHHHNNNNNHKNLMHQVQPVSENGYFNPADSRSPYMIQNLYYQQPGRFPPPYMYGGGFDYWTQAGYAVPNPAQEAMYMQQANGAKGNHNFRGNPVSHHMRPPHLQHPMQQHPPRVINPTEPLNNNSNNKVPAKPNGRAPRPGPRGMPNPVSAATPPYYYGAQVPMYHPVPGAAAQPHPPFPGQSNHVQLPQPPPPPPPPHMGKDSMNGTP